MKKMYVLDSLNWNADDLFLLRQIRAKLKLHKFNLPSTDSDQYGGTVSLDEDKYFKIFKSLKSDIYGRYIYPVFTPKELDSSEMLSITGFYCFNDNCDEYSDAYQPTIYNSDNKCKICYRGKVQHGSYGFRSKPNLKKMKLFYGGDNIFMLFAEKQFYEDVFAPLGIGYMPVNRVRTGKPFDDLIQLKIPTVLEDLDMSGIDFKVCPSCGRRFYPYGINGFYRKYQSPNLPPIFYAKETIGNIGAVPAKMIIVSQMLRRKLIGTGQIPKNNGIPFA